MAKPRWVIFALVVPVVMAGVFWPVGSPAGRRGVVRADAPAPADAQTRPVEDEMHEFMEYVFEPPYKRLKASLAAEPSNKKAWQAVKADSLTLAEAGNLLLIREPDDEVELWVQFAVAVRQLGGQLYGAAKKKNFTAARQHYRTLLARCNRCHDEFADGEHQLTP